MITQETTVTLVVMECGECHVVFGMSQGSYDDAKRNGSHWYCTNGHCRVFTESEVAKLRKQLAAEKHSAEWYKQRSEEQQRALVSRDHVIRAERGAKTRLKRRIAAGLCPCCNRTFQNLAGHMKGQHPEYAEAG